MNKTGNTLQAAYTAPQLTVVSFRCERGYAESDIAQQLKLWELQENGELTFTDQEHVEVYTVEDDWHQGTYGFWD